MSSGADNALDDALAAVARFHTRNACGGRSSVGRAPQWHVSKLDPTRNCSLLLNSAEVANGAIPHVSLPDVSLPDVVNCSCSRCTPSYSPPVSEVTSLLIQSKVASNLRPSYVQGLRQYLALFGQWFGPNRSVSEIDVCALEKWFETRGEKPATRASNVGRLGSLLSFAWRRGWIHENPARRLERPRVDPRSPRILTPLEVEKLLLTCLQKWPRFLTALSLMVFAGVRPVEVQRISWANIDLAAGVLRIEATASKVRSRRVVRLQPACCAWLRLGGDLPCRSHRRHMKRLGKVLGWWQPDALRHAAASYLLAASGDLGRVATQLGNSPGILQRHYLSIVTDADTEAFWSILPASDSTL